MYQFQTPNLVEDFIRQFDSKFHLKGVPRKYLACVYLSKVNNGDARTMRVINFEQKYLNKFEQINTNWVVS